MEFLGSWSAQDDQTSYGYGRRFGGVCDRAYCEVTVVLVVSSNGRFNEVELVVYSMSVG